MPAQTTTLESFLTDHDAVSAPLAVTVTALARAAVTLSGVIAQGTPGDLGEEVGDNRSGDRQRAVDVIADELFASALASTPVRWYASEERAAAEELNPGGTLALAIDPLDGSSNIDVNSSTGTIFSIFEARDTGAESFLRPGHEQIAAGYVVYGPQTALVLAAARTVALFVLDRRVGFLLASDRLRIGDTPEFAINASNYRHWPRAIRIFVDDCLAGDEGPRGANFNMRWIASLVAETHRILMRGGIFLYPSDARPGYQRGRLRLVYECAPIAFIVERACGRATNGIDRILDAAPTDLHQRTPFVFGSAEKVGRVCAYYAVAETEGSPLFGRRGLFTA